jgi:hypothetical protein
LLALPDSVKEHVESGSLAASVAYEVSRIDDADDQAEVAARAIADGMTRSEVVKAVRAKSSKGRAPKARKTSATIRTAAGKVTVENRRGVDDATLLAALREALATIKDRAEAA